MAASACGKLFGARSSAWLLLLLPGLGRVVWLLLLPHVERVAWLLLLSHVGEVAWLLLHMREGSAAVACAGGCAT